MTNEKLGPCPKCGASLVIKERLKRDGAVVRCTGCQREFIW